ncbi:MAG: hypothetical protein C4518_04565 [Desulfobacteraceae bacterium]|nr:MAG: hypothetical protein C4518_04565 [Desulfobacteraceae bacterium]
MESQWLDILDIEKDYRIKAFLLIEPIKKKLLPVYRPENLEEPIQHFFKATLDQSEVDEHRRKKTAADDSIRMCAILFPTYHLKNLIFKREDIIDCFSLHNKVEISKDHVSRAHQQARDRCRDVARQILKENPKMDTIGEAIWDKRMMEAATKDTGYNYSKKTIRGWIKDLFPDTARRPGKRPKR